jgi:hypothetical protein
MVIEDRPGTWALRVRFNSSPAYNDDGPSGSCQTPCESLWRETQCPLSHFPSTSLTQAPRSGSKLHGSRFPTFPKCDVKCKCRRRDNNAEHRAGIVSPVGNRTARAIRPIRSRIVLDPPGPQHPGNSRPEPSGERDDESQLTRSNGQGREQGEILVMCLNSHDLCPGRTFVRSRSLNIQASFMASCVLNGTP